MRLTETLRRLTRRDRTLPRGDSEGDAALVLLVGLGNPGPRYRSTRHNVGMEWAQSIAERIGIELRESKRFFGAEGQARLLGRSVRILLPSTYMNRSGQSVAAMVNYFGISLDQVLIAHDEVAYAPGKSRLKIGGGTNGHNGLSDVIAALGNRSDFARLRIGIGHPGDPLDMVPYLTKRSIPQGELEAISKSLDWNDQLLDLVLACDWQRAMTMFHSEEPKPDSRSTAPS